VIKRRRFGCADDVVRTGKGKVPAGFQSGNLKEKRRLVDLDLDGKM